MERRVKHGGDPSILAQYAATSQNVGDAGMLAKGVLYRPFSIFFLEALLSLIADD